MNKTNFKIYIGCLPGHATESKVEDIFSKFGELIEISLARKEDANQCQKCVGSGHITCKDFTTFNNIIKQPEICYEDRKLEVSKFLEKSDLEKLHKDVNQRKILVKYLESSVTDEDLKTAFGLFGKVSNAFVSSDKKPNLKAEFPSNYGMVIMETPLATYKALNGRILIKGNPVIVRLHRFRNVKDAIYEVNGKTYTADDLLGIQIGKDPRHDISWMMPKEYGEMERDWHKKQEIYQRLVLFDRKKLKKECKRKKDKELKSILVEMDRIEREKKKNLEKNEEKKKNVKEVKEGNGTGEFVLDQARKLERVAIPINKIINNPIPKPVKQIPIIPTQIGPARGSSYPKYNNIQNFNSPLQRENRPNCNQQNHNYPPSNGYIRPVSRVEFNMNQRRIPTRTHSFNSYNYPSPAQLPPSSPFNNYQSYGSSNFSNDDMYNWSKPTPNQSRSHHNLLNSRSPFNSNNQNFVHQRTPRSFQFENSEHVTHDYTSLDAFNTPNNPKINHRNGKNLSSSSPVNQSFDHYLQPQNNTERKSIPDPQRVIERRKRINDKFRNTWQNKSKPLIQIKEVEEEIKGNSSHGRSKVNKGPKEKSSSHTFKNSQKKISEIFLKKGKKAKRKEKLKKKKKALDEEMSASDSSSDSESDEEEKISIKKKEKVLVKVEEKTKEENPQKKEKLKAHIHKGAGIGVYLNFESFTRKISPFEQLQIAEKKLKEKMKKREKEMRKKREAEAKKAGIDQKDLPPAVYEIFKEDESQEERKISLPITEIAPGTRNFNFSNQAKRFKSMNDKMDFKLEGLMKRNKQKRKTVDKVENPILTEDRRKIFKEDEESTKRSKQKKNQKTANTKYEKRELDLEVLCGTEYKELLALVYKEYEQIDQVIRSRRIAQDLVYERWMPEEVDKYLEINWVQKMVNNLRFKVSFNHYQENIRLNRPRMEEEEDVESLMERLRGLLRQGKLFL